MTDRYLSVVRTLTRGLASSGYTQKRLPFITSVNTFAAIESDTGRYALVFEVETNHLVGSVEWPQSVGFACEMLACSESPERSRVCIAMTDPDYESVFVVLAEDILKVLEQTEDARQALKICHERLWEWQLFFKKHGPAGLSAEERAGLYGELHILEQYLIPTIGSATSVRAWRGCKKANQDFQFSSTAVEVKATRATIPDSVHISNVQQLENSGVADLYLAVVHLRHSPTETESLPDAIYRIKESLPAYEASEFLSGLNEVGYAESQADLYAEDRYTALDTRLYAVRDNFPRIRSCELASGIKSVRYEIGLDACKDYSVDIPDMVRSLTLDRRGKHDQ